ncbi:unnamed protein product, partial [Nesidiocoris tenuis]
YIFLLENFHQSLPFFAPLLHEVLMHQRYWELEICVFSLYSKEAFECSKPFSNTDRMLSARQARLKAQFDHILTAFEGVQQQHHHTANSSTTNSRNQPPTTPQTPPPSLHQPHPTHQIPRPTPPHPPKPPHQQHHPLGTPQIPPPPLYLHHSHHKSQNNTTITAPNATTKNNTNTNTTKYTINLSITSTTPPLHQLHSKPLYHRHTTTTTTAATHHFTSTNNSRRVGTGFNTRNETEFKNLVDSNPIVALRVNPSGNPNI